MAAQTLRQLIQTLSENDRFLDLLILECISGCDKVKPSLREAVENEDAIQKFWKGELYEMLIPFYPFALDSIYELDLSQLQDEFLLLIKCERPDELVGLVEGLEHIKIRIDRANERLVELMRDFDIEPFYHLSSLAAKCFQEVEAKESRVLRVSDVAIRMYGFKREIALEIEESLGQRKLIKKEKLFDSGEDDEIWQEKDEQELNWVEAHKLRNQFEELKKKIFKNPESDDLKVEKKIVSDDKEDYLASQRATFLGVIRNWIFEIESVLFNLVIYELYYMLRPWNETDEAIFRGYKAKLKNLVEINHGMVPITVYETIHMMEKENGVVIRRPAESGSNRQRKILHENVRLNDVMDKVHEMILRLSSVLTTSGLSYPHIMREDEVSVYENVLKQCEEEVKDMERNINWAKSKSATDTDKAKRRRKSDSLEDGAQKE